MGQTGAISSRKRCKLGLAIKLTLFLRVYSTVLLAPDICNFQSKRRCVSPHGVRMELVCWVWVPLAHRQRYGQKPLHTMVGRFWANYAPRVVFVSYIGPLHRINTKHKKSY